MSVIHFRYPNKKNEIVEREVDVDSLEYQRYPGDNHQPGWFISGFDTAKAARWSFALTKIILPAQPPTSGANNFCFVLMNLKGN